MRRPKPKKLETRSPRQRTRPQTAGPPPERGLAARRLALALIDAVLARRRSLDDALAATSPQASGELEPRDRAFARLMAATVLRRHGQLTALIDAFVSQPLPEDARRAHHILLLAAAQLMFLDAAPHAVIDTAVTLCKAHKRTYRFRGLVNAVLRRIAERGRELVAQQDEIALNVPSWMLAGWQDDFGPALARDIAAASLREADLDLTVKSDAPQWAEKLGGRALTDWSVRLGEASGRIDALAGFAEGAWWVQDFAASLPARLLGPVARGHVADLCAAPGGKSAQLAAAGAQVIAVDSSAQRLERLSANFARLGLAASIIAADARTWTPDAPLDGILLDAPCSATGTIRRHPDILHLKSPDDVTALAALQANMLGHAADQLAPGGVLVYCTCSLQKAEGEDQIARVLAARHDLERMPVSADEIGGLAHLVSADGDVRTLPCHAPAPADMAPGMDGFFVSRLRKRR